MTFKITSARFDQEASSREFVQLHVVGTTTSGKPFDGLLGLEMDGRDCDWEGTSFGDEEYEELMEPLLDSFEDNVYATAAYAEAVAWSDLQYEHTCHVCNKVNLGDDTLALVHETHVCKECRDAKCHLCEKPPTSIQEIWGVSVGQVPAKCPEGTEPFRYSCSEHGQIVFDSWIDEYL